MSCLILALKMPRCIRFSKYIAAPSHGVPYRPEIVEAMKDEIHVYGRAFCAAKAG